MSRKTVLWIQLTRRNAAKNDLYEVATSSSLEPSSATRNAKSKYIRYLMNVGRSQMLNAAAKTRSKTKDIKKKLIQAAKNARKRKTRQRQQEIGPKSTGFHKHASIIICLDIPNQEVTRELYQRFFEATNNAAVRHYIYDIYADDTVWRAKDILQPGPYLRSLTVTD